MSSQVFTSTFYLLRLLTFLVGSILLISSAQAGIVEVSVSTSLRNSKIDDNNSVESQSYTGAVSYYFMAMSALELSYTKGTSIQKAYTGLETLKFKSNFTYLGADLIFTLGDKSSVLQPYIKGGIAKISKEITIVTETSATTNQEPDKTALSSGLGIKIGLTQSLSIKIGVDAWLTKNDSGEQTIDYAGRGGISWLF